jgi:hypothetical protein
MRLLLITTFGCAMLGGCQPEQAIKQLDCYRKPPGGEIFRYPSTIFNQRTGQIYRYDSFREVLQPDNRVYASTPNGDELLVGPTQEILVVNGKIKHRRTYPSLENEILNNEELVILDAKTLKAIYDKQDGKDISHQIGRYQCKWGYPKTTMIADEKNT